MRKRNSIFKRIKNQIKSKLANRNNESKLKYLRAKGAIIGNGTLLNCNVGVLGSEPYLINIGEKCLFSSGVRCITHDGGVTVLNNLGFFNGTRMDRMARIKIGNNVYIGTGAMIMPGVTIGNNCIIGAGAIVTKDIPDDSVAVGIPAKRIKSIQQYYEDAKNKGQFYPTLLMSPKDKKEYLIKNVKHLD